MILTRVSNVLQDVVVGMVVVFEAITWRDRSQGFRSKEWDGEASFPNGAELEVSKSSTLVV
jgi:hypothetical protein